MSVFPLQGPEHPNPGKPFTARGFPRQCYLPDSVQGRKVKATFGKGPLVTGDQGAGWAVGHSVLVTCCVLGILGVLGVQGEMTGTS